MGELRFKDKKAFNQAVNRHVKPIIEKEKVKIVKDIWASIEPVISTCLYEAYGFGEVRQQKFFKYLKEHMLCLEEGYTVLEMYLRWCKDHNYSIYEVGQEDENGKTI